MALKFTQLYKEIQEGTVSPTKTVIPTKEQQIVRPNEGDASIESVIVKAVPITDKITVTPTKLDQNILPESNDLAIDSVLVKAVTNEIDNNIKAENIKQGVSILGVKGELEGTIIPKTAKAYYEMYDEDGYPTQCTIINTSNIAESMFYVSENDNKNINKNLQTISFNVNDNCVDIENDAFTNKINPEYPTSIVLPNCISIHDNNKGFLNTKTSHGAVTIDKVKYLSNASNSTFAAYQFDSNISNGDVLSINNNTKYLLPHMLANVPSGISIAITIPSNITEISPYAFANTMNWDNLRYNINMLGNVTNIRDHAFYNRFAYNDRIKFSSYNWQSTVLSIGRGAFHCTYLNSCNFPNVTQLNDSTFYSCMFSEFSLPLVSYIGSSAFYNCYYLTQVYLPEVLEIGNNAFGSCTSIKFAVLPKCKKLNQGAFYNCRSLSSISLPNCEYVGNNAFGGQGTVSYPLITDISLPKCSYIGDYAFTPGGYSNTTLKSIYIGGENLKLNYNAFYNCKTLQSISIPNCSYIGSSAFYSCSSLSYINVGKCSYIGSHAFAYCSSLTNFIGDSVEQVESGAFHNCFKLSSINLPECKYIGSSAFYFCSNATEINIPKCEYLQSYALSPSHKASNIIANNLIYLNSMNFNSPSLKTLPTFSKLERLDAYALASNSLISELITSTIYAFQQNALASCNNLSKIEIYTKSNKVYFGSSVFTNCINLKSVYLPEIYNEGLGTQTFANCSKLSYVSFGTSFSAFSSYCSYYTDIASPSFSFTTYSYNATQQFANCTSLNTLVLPFNGLVRLDYSGTFSNTGIANGTGHIYVPSSLVDVYKYATNWAYYSNRFSAIETLVLDFDIDGVTYSANHGTTWENWVNSDYNISGFQIINGKVCNASGKQVDTVTSSDKITYLHKKYYTFQEKVCKI